jgi:hypothetical protein
MSAQPYGPIVTDLDQVQLQNETWLWPNRIPLGAITTLINFGDDPILWQRASSSAAHPATAEITPQRARES